MSFTADLPKIPGTYRHRWIDHAGRMREQTLYVAQQVIAAGLRSAIDLALQANDLRRLARDIEATKTPNY